MKIHNEIIIKQKLIMGVSRFASRLLCLAILSMLLLNHAEGGLFDKKGVANSPCQASAELCKDKIENDAKKAGGWFSENVWGPAKDGGKKVLNP